MSHLTEVCMDICNTVDRVSTGDLRLNDARAEIREISTKYTNHASFTTDERCAFETCYRMSLGKLAKMEYNYYAKQFGWPVIEDTICV